MICVDFLVDPGNFHLADPCSWKSRRYVTIRAWCYGKIIQIIELTLHERRSNESRRKKVEITFSAMQQRIIDRPLKI
jgi:hypothetical protein